MNIAIIDTRNDYSNITNPYKLLLCFFNYEIDYSVLEFLIKYEK